MKHVNHFKGYVRVFRSLSFKGYYKKSELLHLWIHLLLKANHTTQEIMVNGELKKLYPGQFLTSRAVLSSETGINESKIQRGLKFFQKEKQIEQKTTNDYRIISITNWYRYQRFEQASNSDRTTNVQPMNTDNNEIKFKNEKKKEERITPIKIKKILMSAANKKWIDQKRSNVKLLDEIINDYSLKIVERGQATSDLNRLQAGLERHIIFYQDRKKRFSPVRQENPKIIRKINFSPL